jgi:ABC-type branched-subunit amino acid transport system ATPase component
LTSFAGSNEGMTFVLVEHVMPIVMSIADQIVVMNFGQKWPTEPQGDHRG